MKIRLLSDLHFEGFKNNDLYKNRAGADVLVLAGDIAVGAFNVIEHLIEFAKTHERVVYVPGNHEWYHNSYKEFDSLMRMANLPANVSYLCNDKVTFDDITFIGTPLLTNFRGNPANGELMRGLISDFKWQNPKECFELGQAAQEWLKFEYENTPGKKVIITHWIPAIECISPRFRDEKVLNMYFANDMGAWTSELQDVPFWFFGHTHDSVDITLGDTRLVANPAGYRRRFGILAYENANFIQDVIYEV